MTVAPAASTVVTGRTPQGSMLRPPMARRGAGSRPGEKGNHMKKQVIGLVAIAALCVLPSCGTTNGVRWAYGKTSIYGEPDTNTEGGAVRAIFGVPVIVGGVVVDAVTWPAQALFGVWPLWGDKSTVMKPKGV